MATKPTKPKPPTVTQRRLIPREFVGSEGVRGNWAKAPRVDASKWETGVNEFGRFFIRPRTELTGLDPQAVADVRDFDALTQRQGQRITAAHEDYARQSAADRDAATTALGNLANLAGAAYTPRTLGNPAPGGVTGPGLSGAEQMLPAILGLGAREQSMAQSAQTIAGMNTLPTVARSEGLGAVERFTGERQGQRAEFLKGLRQTQAEAESAAAEQRAEQERWQRDLAATLRGQNLDLLGQLGGQQTDLSEAMLRSDTDLAIANQKAQTGALGDSFRNPRQLRTGGYTLGPWTAKPKPRKGITLEQGTDGRWYGKPAKGSSGGKSASLTKTQNRALGDLSAFVGKPVPHGKEGEPGYFERPLSATEAANEAAREHGVNRTWAYNEARRLGYHHRAGEWQPSAWRRTNPTAREPWKPSTAVGQRLAAGQG